METKSRLTLGPRSTSTLIISTTLDRINNLLGGRKAATKFFGTLGRSSWTYNDLHLSLSPIPNTCPKRDGPEGRTKAEMGSSIHSPPWERTPSLACWHRRSLDQFLGSQRAVAYLRHPGEAG